MPNENETNDPKGQPEVDELKVGKVMDAILELNEKEMIELFHTCFVDPEVDLGNLLRHAMSKLCGCGIE